MEKPLFTCGCVTRVLPVPLAGSVAEVIICVVLSGLVSGKGKGESSGQVLEFVGIAAAYVVGENLDLRPHLAAGSLGSIVSAGLLSPKEKGRRDFRRKSATVTLASYFQCPPAVTPWSSCRVAL